MGEVVHLLPMGRVREDRYEDEELEALRALSDAQVQVQRTGSVKDSMRVVAAFNRWKAICDRVCS